MSRTCQTILLQLREANDWDRAIPHPSARDQGRSWSRANAPANHWRRAYLKICIKILSERVTLQLREAYDRERKILPPGARDQGRSKSWMRRRTTGGDEQPAQAPTTGPSTATTGTNTTTFTILCEIISLGSLINLKILYLCLKKIFPKKILFSFWIFRGLSKIFRT